MAIRVKVSAVQLRRRAAGKMPSRDPRANLDAGNTVKIQLEPLSER